MNLVDIIIIVVVLLWMVRGYYVGFMMTLTTLCGMVVGLICAIYLSKYLAEAMQSFINDEMTRHLLAYLLIFLIVAIIFRIIGLLLRELIKKMKLGGADSVLGVLASAVEALLLIMIALLVIIQSPWEKTKAEVRNSLIAPYMLEGAKIAVFNLPEHLRKQIVRDIDNPDVKHEPSPSPSPTSSPEIVDKNRA